MTMTPLSKTLKPKDSVLPLPPAAHMPGSHDERTDMAIYARFMRYLRHVPNSRMDIKILSSIQFTADMLDHSDAHIAKVLVDLGLRAPRMAFPADFLDYADAALMRDEWQIGGANGALHGLREYWNAIGEDKFSGVKKQYSLADEALYARG